MINWAALANWFGSAVGWGVTAFLSTLLLDGTMDWKLRLHAAGSAFVVALAQHLRDNPFSPPKP